MEKIILTDCDGVLLNWNRGFEKFLESRGFPRLPNTEAEYNISARHGVSYRQAIEFVREFNESPAVADLDVFADSKEYVFLLSQLGFRFIAVTAISDHPASYQYRKQNLMYHFGDVFDELHCIEMGASKANILTRWADTGYFWIEDHMRQAEAGAEVGLKTILINHPYNEHYHTDLFPKVSVEQPWKEIYQIVVNHYDL